MTLNKPAQETAVTWNAVIGGLEVRLEVLGARLSDRVHRGDQQRTVLSARAHRVHVTGDVTVAAERVGVVRRDAAARPHATVQRTAHDNHVTRVIT